MAVDILLSIITILGHRDSCTEEKQLARSHIGLDEQGFQSKIGNIFLPISFNLCFGCSKEPSHSDGSFEYPQHIFWLRNRKVKFPLRTQN